VGLRTVALLLAVMTGLMAILGTWSEVSSLMGGLWRLPLGLLLLGLAYERWQVQRLGLQVHASAVPSLLGKQATVELRFTHRWQRTVDLELAPAAPAAVEIDNRIRTLQVPPGVAGATEAISVTARRLGLHPWPALRVRAAGALGLAWWTRGIHCDFSLRVIPDVLDSAARRMGAIEAGPQAAVVSGVGSEVLQLRDYRTGDAPRCIDWKASARTGRLVSRDFSEDQHLEIVIAIDAGRASALKAGSMDRLGQYANLAARFAENAVLHDDMVGLLIFADRPLAACAPARGLNGVLRIRQLLSTMRIVEAESNPLNAALRIRSLVRHRSLIIMLTDLDDATVAGQLATAARLLLPKHLPLIAGLASPEVEQLAWSPAEHWLAPFEALAAQEYCARLHGNVRALRAMGAPALMAQPAQFEHAVFAAYAQFKRRRQV
jgi:uncharacterized protein (DUF58 family)